MSDLDLEDRLTHSLHRGAGPAPLPSSAVRQSVRRRSRSLRRRRGAVQAASVAAVASLVAGAGVALRSGGGNDPLSTFDEPYMDPPHRGAWPQPPAGDGTLPTFAIDGFELTPGTPLPGDGPGSEDEPPPALGHQTFREPGNYSGPVVGVEHKACDDCSGLEAGLPDADRADQVTIDGRDALLWLLPPDGRILSWTLADGSRVVVSSRDLTTAEVVQFAEGLERRGDLGFTATELPRGLAEDTTDGLSHGQVPRRLDGFDAGATGGQLVATQGDERLMVGETGPFSNNLYVDVAEHVTVLGRPAVLIHVDDGIAGSNDLDPYWDLVWRHTTDSVVLLRFSDVDRAEVDQIIAGLRET